MAKKHQRRAKSEYDAVTIEVHWPGLSFFAFALTVPFNHGRMWIWSDRTALIVAGLNVVGLVAGLVGCADRRRRRWAIVGTVLNGIMLVAQLLIEWIYRDY